MSARDRVEGARVAAVPAGGVLEAAGRRPGLGALCGIRDVGQRRVDAGALVAIPRSADLWATHLRWKAQSRPEPLPTMGYSPVVESPMTGRAECNLCPRLCSY